MSDKKVVKNSTGPAKGTRLDATRTTTKKQQEEEENPHAFFENFSPLPQNFPLASQNLPSIDARGPAVGEDYRTIMGLETTLPRDNTSGREHGIG